MAQTKQTAHKSNGRKAQGCMSIMDPGKLKIRIPAQTMPYYGFFRDTQPILPFFLPVRVQLETSKRSKISASHILITHFKLVDHMTTGSPVDIIHQFLVLYFPYGGLCKLDIVFDLGTSFKVKGYNEKCMELAKDVIEHDYYKSGDKSGYISSSVPEFLNVLFKPWQDAITHTKDMTMFFMGCRAIVNNTKSFCDLHLSVLNSKLSSAIAFTAPHFQPSFTCHLQCSNAPNMHGPMLQLIHGDPCFHSNACNAAA
ncbi:hypothetical protein BD769DRAFT_1384253 [Suillus cothurnatus]|nr:hypothetical protein BD769DRAFT_1384253 [Suillus cothurnatus]